MKRFKMIVLNITRGMSRAGQRFPLTVVSLFVATGILCYMISLRDMPGLLIQKIMFSLVVGAFLGMAAQFATERFDKLLKHRAVVYGVSLLVIIGYFFILWPAPEISGEIGVRTFVAIFAILCAVLWIPSCQNHSGKKTNAEPEVKTDAQPEGKTDAEPETNAEICKSDFNIVALIHTKAIFISFLYSGVLSAGISAIILSVDILLFKVNTDSYAYMLTFVWVLFAPIYYLSLLPKFGSDESTDIEMMERSEKYPKFLEILVSYIAIPLITAYTLVLLVYFVKILVTLNWPSGQVAPMVLIYSAVGLIVFVLSSLLDNRFTKWYRFIFPKVLIPVVIMQLVSVGIRLNAYGVTESRYYVALFGVFSIATALLLSFRPVSKNRFIALLAAGFAIVSIIPPVDAFTVSRNSQINRVETILSSEGILKDGKLTPKSAVSDVTKSETTSILTYLDNRSSLKYITWLPEDFNLYEDMKTTVGFDLTWSNNPGENPTYFYASLDAVKPLNISGYDISVNAYSNRSDKLNASIIFHFAVRGTDYVLSVERISKDEAIVSVKDSAGNELIKTGLNDFAKKIAGTGDGSPSKDSLSPEDMTLEVNQNGYKLKIIFQNISITYGNGTDAGTDYGTILFFASPL